MTMHWTVLLLASMFGCGSLAAATLTGGYTVGSGLLTPGEEVLFVDNAATGGGDARHDNGVPGWSAELVGLWNPGDHVSLTGLALPIWSHPTDTVNTTASGTFTFSFYDLSGGANPDAFDGTGSEPLVGTATASFTQGTVAAYSVVFDVPVTFTAGSSGVAIHMVNTDALRLKINTAAVAPGVVRKSNTDGAPAGGTYPNMRLSLAGIVTGFLPTRPNRVNLAKYQVTTASTENGDYQAPFATDGVVGNDNSWRTDNVTTPHWAEVVFPTPITAHSAHVFTGIDDGSVLASFKVQYRPGGSWIDVPGALVAGNSSTAVNVIFSVPVTADRFRLYSDENGNERVKEFALFPPNPNPTNGVEQGFPIGTDVELNLAKKRPVTASALNGANYPKLAVDGFVGNASRWETALVGSNALEIDLRVSTKIGSAHLYSGGPGSAPLSDFLLQYWTGSAWADISGGSVSGNTDGARVVDFGTEPTTSRVRLVFTNTTVSAVKELCIFPANGGSGYALGQDVIGAPPPTQQFEDYGDAYYSIRNRASSTSICISGGAPTLDPGNLDGDYARYQVLLNVGTETYRLRNRMTGQCLAGAGLARTPGALLVDEDYTGMPHQSWRLVAIDGTDFYLENQWSGLVIDTQGGSISGGTPLVQNTNNASTTQRWRFVHSTHYPKKGTAGFVNNWSQFKANWSYNWGRGDNVGSLPNHVVFNPMQWGNFNWNIGDNQGPLSQFISQWHREDKAMYFMGFNEPDGADQSNLTVDKAIELWPRLERMDMPLVSPVTKNPLNSWMNDFMSQAQGRGYRMDAVAAHKYPGPNGGSPSSLISELQTVYTTWGRPVWFTEFSTVDWNGTGTWTEEDNYNWLAEFMWRAESLSWLRRYSLFLFTADANNPVPVNPWDPVAPRSNTFDASGTPTAFGELYFAWDCDANVRGDKAYFIHNKGERKRIRNAVGSTVPSHGSIREGTHTTQWVLRAAPTPGQWYITSLRDGRRLRYSGGVVDFAPENTTGTSVTWTWVEDQHGWFYLENIGAPASNRRLKDTAGVFSMVSNTNTGDQLKWRLVPPFDAASTAPPAPVNLAATAGTNQVGLTWSSGGSSGIAYSIYRSTTTGGSYSLIASNLAALSYLDTSVPAGIAYYYVATAWDVTGGQSPHSNEASATPVQALPTTPTNLTFTVSNHLLMVSWPSNYTGWLLQAQTNALASGLGTNWFTLPGSETNSSFLAPINPANPAVFYRLTRP